MAIQDELKLFVEEFKKTNGRIPTQNEIVKATRKKAYGDIGEQLDEIYKDIDAWKARIKKIKDDNPKE